MNLPKRSKKVSQNVLHVTVHCTSCYLKHHVQNNHSSSPTTVRQPPRFDSVIFISTTHIDNKCHDRSCTIRQRFQWMVRKSFWYLDLHWQHFSNPVRRCRKKRCRRCMCRTPSIYIDGNQQCLQFYSSKRHSRRLLPFRTFTQGHPDHIWHTLSNTLDHYGPVTILLLLAIPLEKNTQRTNKHTGSLVVIKCRPH